SRRSRRRSAPRARTRAAAPAGRTSRPGRAAGRTSPAGPAGPRSGRSRTAATSPGPRTSRSAPDRTAGTGAAPWWATFHPLRRDPTTPRRRVAARPGRTRAAGGARLADPILSEKPLMPSLSLSVHVTSVIGQKGRHGPLGSDQGDVPPLVPHPSADRG